MSFVGYFQYNRKIIKDTKWNLFSTENPAFFSADDFFGSPTASIIVFRKVTRLARK